MNRLRGRKKVKDDLAAPRPSVESESSGPFKMFGKNKKSQEEEPKKDIDITAALPSTDDFRTSLLMTGLSARFSMLREQDDPNTKVGKASDDSVLFPKRQSRLDLGLSSTGLGDIAEVESLKTPPFARMDSFQSSDDGSTSGSIMSRSKPIEGNNLFGGRQKIYKIAVSGSNGGLSGRALYDGDVAQSAFQKWRQSEKERQSSEEERHEDTQESELTRPESPAQLDFNRRRETNSTTSSGPSAARNSTAATSITSSQPASSVKERPESTAAQSVTGPNPSTDRTVTRTRRLYEQSLNQDLHEQQSSALSRIDILSKQRAFGTRTPDLTPTAPSPTSTTFSERFGDRRPILSKASAPNLRSFSPSASRSSQMSPADSDNRFPGFEQRTSFGVTPPLSPPISESEEYNSLHIQPNDRGKATAMGVFNRPTAQYDESRFAQRQLQMQQGRETPTNRIRAGSNTSNTSMPDNRSRSSSAQRTPFEKSDSTTLKPEPTVQEETPGVTFLDDADDDDQPPKPEAPRTHTQTAEERPDDQIHPALRQSAVPTPLSLAIRSPGDPSPIREKPEILASTLKNAPPEDSPTLGPATGLSGMVRQHLRNESNDSSIYDGAPEEVELAARFPPGPQSPGNVSSRSNPWESTECDWTLSLDDELSPTRSRVSTEPRSPPVDVSASVQDSATSVADDKETDEFARHLADGARRVRERLTSYVESDNGRTTPTAAQDLPPPPRTNALGILKSKSSRGSLTERNREGHSGLNPKKLLGLGSSTMATTPSPRRTSLEGYEETSKQDQPQTEETDDRSSPERENVHAGLKAFRQARRELQRMKEIEVQQRYQGPPPAAAAQPKGPPAGRERAPGSRAESRPGSRAQSRERGPPPVTYNRIPSEENSMRSRSGSRAPSERDRSGSETSNSGRSGSRPARLRNGSLPYDELHSPLSLPSAPSGTPRQGPMLRSPGLPGTDIKRSPHMPPQPYPGSSASPGRFNRSQDPPQSLHVQPFGGNEPGQPSPVSPINGMPSSYGPSAPAPSRPIPQQPGMMDPSTDPNTKRAIRKRDISEPSFVSTTSQVPTVQLDGAPGSRSRNGSLLGAAASTPNLHGSAAAPPLPPINPRRKNMMGGFLRRSEDEASPRSSQIPVSASGADGGRDTFLINSEEGGPAQFRQKLRKATSEANGLNSRAKSTRQSPPRPLARPPPPRAMTGNMPGGMI